MDENALSRVRLFELQHKVARLGREGKREKITT